MSSLPFRIGIPIVDYLEPITGDYVLRSKNEEAHIKEIQKLQERLTTEDVIKIYRIGLRPDHPVPIAAFFTEVHVGIGEMKETEKWVRLWSSVYHNIVSGLKDPK